MNRNTMKTTYSLVWKKGMVVLMVVALVSCNLDVKIKDPNVILPVSASGAPQPQSISQIYNQLSGLTTDQGDWFALGEHTTDEMMGPTRGTDWDDFGTWRKLHLHTWDGTHNQIVTAWNNLQAGLFQTTLLAESTTAAASDIAAAKFLRSFWRYMSMDLFGVVQHRPATAASLDLPQVYTRSQGWSATVGELRGAIANLPAYNGTNRGLATKEAAYFLLAKLYLNRAVFQGDPTKPAGPFNFAKTDMDSVVYYVDQITANGMFSIASHYWDNFSWQNGTNSTENIFVRRVQDGGNMRWPTYMGNHYNMVPSGWNGFVILSDFYNKFDTLNDSRAFDTLKNHTRYLFRNVGFLTGLQYGPTDPSTGKHYVGAPKAALTDRSGSPLVFTKSASLFFSTEAKGYRSNKYPLDPNSLTGSGDGSSSTNDYVFYRYADAKLMKAEAILRGSTISNTGSETATTIVNAIRANRSNYKNNALATIGNAALQDVLDERGRELYLETVRRNDLVRFGIFNQPVTQRSVASDPTRCLFPIPYVALSSNPNLKQNPGY